MRGLRLGVAVVLVLGACTNGGGPSPDSRRLVADDEVPWTLRVPSEWHTSVRRLDPEPNSRVGVLSMWAANSPHDARLTRQQLGGALGDDGAALFVLRLWVPGKALWAPRKSELTERGPSQWHEEAQSPGWMFRERKLCRGSECVSVMEWHGRSASELDIRYLEEMADSVRLTERRIS